MSGTFRHRVNRLWDQEQANMSVPAFFWEWLKYVQDHTGLSFVGYGTGKTQSGTTPPAGWIDSFDPTSDVSPYSDNAWFVFEAVNADNTLDGNGGNPWQAKIQMTTTTGFDDCNVADTDYDQEAETWCVCMRSSVASGWVGSGTLDFQPVGGEAISDNARMMNGQDVKFIMDIIGDDDTLHWDGACFSGALSNADARTRGGHIGMLNRRSSAIDYPFIMTIGRMHDGTAGANDAAINRCGNSVNYQWASVQGTTTLTPGSFRWPTYTLWTDLSKIEGNDVHKHDCWHIDDRTRMTPDPVTGDIVRPDCLVSQWKDPNKYAIIGVLRLIGATGKEFGHGAVVGSNSDMRQFCQEGTLEGGMLMDWPAGVVSIW